MVLIGLYRDIAKRFTWSLKEIDETNLETLFDFLTYEDPNVRVVNGKEYRRAQGVPKWL
jgi:hypothetical protein|nr:MAG TPA: hypothetical protein [Caudoviricetes sp.]